MTTDKIEKNWPEIKETILILNVAVARIEHAMVEGNDSFTTLSESFIEIVNSTNDISSATNELKESPTKTKIKENCSDISQRVESSIVAFQFYDKLSQRMTLVSKTLNSLTELLQDSNKTKLQDGWAELKNTIRSKYTLDADQEMFDAVLNGMPIDKALKIAIEKTTDNEIELF